jgi:hypothetical protein
MGRSVVRQTGTAVCMTEESVRKRRCYTPTVGVCDSRERHYLWRSKPQHVPQYLRQGGSMQGNGTPV